MNTQQQNDIRPVVGHPTAWRAAEVNRIQPFQLTPGSTDTMCVRVREKIDIRGVGMDVIDMEGVFTVRRDHPCPVDGSPEPKWGESCVKTEFRSLELVGQSKVFGTVRVHLDPEHASFGEVAPGPQGSLAADCVAHCYPAVELPDMGLLLTTGGQAVDLASKVVQIPPIGDVARSQNSALLVDKKGNVVGEIVSSDIEVGEVVCSFPLGSTGGHGHSHAAGEHVQPSGPSFYAETPATGDGHTEITPRPQQPGTRPQQPTTVHPQPTQPSKPTAGGTGTFTAELAAAIAGVLSRLETELTSLAEIIRKAATK
jgi:hypothetical protein